MNKKTINSHLENMEGKTFQYGGQIHYVKECIIDEKNDKFTIKTNRSHFERSVDALSEFLSYWQPIDQISSLQPAPSSSNDLIGFVERENDLSSKLIDILNDNISKVQTNKDYIPQAQAINNSINTIVNIAKMRVDFVKNFKQVFPPKKSV